MAEAGFKWEELEAKSWGTNWKIGSKTKEACLLSVHLSIHSLIHPLFPLSICLSVCPSIPCSHYVCPSIHPSFVPIICLSVSQCACAQKESRGLVTGADLRLSGHLWLLDPSFAPCCASCASNQTLHDQKVWVLYLQCCGLQASDCDKPGSVPEEHPPIVVCHCHNKVHFFWRALRNALGRWRSAHPGLHPVRDTL